MLELRNIVKDYVSGDYVTHALKGISVNFRKQEFVSILGQSGCGKTTLLNIIGGLDRYTDGDLLINGKSTKEYKDRDWDTYRNHSIGFVFQNYNLISHQNILQNVELALTISGVPEEERRQRAYNALKIVGLEGMEKKKPNQLSGGQCQRVAIARALINNPEILLADEPTGALDSETSIQIMNLLKEVSTDRLVIMVTHNPDLAYKYSTRIVRMSDGLLLEDSNPFDGEVKKHVKSPEIPENSEENEDISKGRKKQTSMSLLTSMRLSTSNLLSKMRRTVLVTIAGSIGIIGVSAVLGVSRGVKDYINDLQNDMLSSYPLRIAEESVDLTSLMTGLNSRNNDVEFKFDVNDPKVGVDSMISYLMDAYSDMTNVKTNTIDEKLVSYINGIRNVEGADVGDITFNYGIDPTNNIFGKWLDQETGTEDFYSFNGITQRYIAELNTLENFKSYASFVDLFTAFMHELPDNKDYILDQYEVLKGEYKTGEDDLVLVVDQDTTLTDVLLGQMGVFDHNSFIDIAQCAIEVQEKKKEEGFDKLPKDQQDAEIQAITDLHDYAKDFTYDDLLGRDFYYFPHDTIYNYNPHIADGIKSYPFSFPILDGSNLKTFVSLQFVSYFDYDVLSGIQIYHDGVSYKTRNVICASANTFDPEAPEVENKEGLSGLWFAFDPADIRNLDVNNLDYSTILPQSKFAFFLNAGSDYCRYGRYNPDAVFNFEDTEHINIDITWADEDDIVEPVSGYEYSANASSAMINDYDNPTYKGRKLKISSILRLKESKNFGSLSRGLYYSKAFADKYMADSITSEVAENMKAHINAKGTHNTEYKKAYVTYKYRDYEENDDSAKKIKDGYASSLNADLTYSFGDLFSGLTGIDYSETNAVYLRSLCGLKAINVVDEATNKFDHCDFKSLPREIEIYPKSFESKNRITKYLDAWNSDDILKIDGEDYGRAARDELTYTDTISLIVAVIDTFINAITIALVVFTSLSLVVSCFMIAVITYISVVERIKEIGVIRSLGGRKSDVANLFVMETLMTGLFSGVFGVLMTYLLQIIVNVILKIVFGIAIMHLTWWTALIMITVSVVLSILSGLIPSQSAAHKDPVVALRSNE